MDDVVAELRPEFGDIAVQPVLPRADASAIRVLVRAVKAGRSTRTDYPPLSLNDGQGQPTAAAEAVLREGKTLTIAEI